MVASSKMVRLLIRNQTSTGSVLCNCYDSFSINHLLRCLIILSTICLFLSSSVLLFVKNIHDWRFISICKWIISRNFVAFGLVVMGRRLGRMFNMMGMFFMFCIVCVFVAMMIGEMRGAFFYDRERLKELLICLSLTFIFLKIRTLIFCFYLFLINLNWILS